MASGLRPDAPVFSIASPTVNPDTDQKHSTSSDEDSFGHLQADFGPLLSISEESLVALSSNIRRRISGQNQSHTCHLISRLNGSYNLVHIVLFEDGVKYVIRVPSMGWGDQITKAAKNALRSQALTMRFIRGNTSIPVPEVYEFDTTDCNAIGAPYIAMSFIPGFTVASKWEDTDGPTSLEERRRRTLDTVAAAMSQLDKLRFNKIGSLIFDDGSAEHKYEIGPCYGYDVGEYGDPDYGKKVNVEEFGPFTTSKSYMQYLLNDSRDRNEDAVSKGCRKIVAMMLQYLPYPRDGHETFVLSPPDFDSQNVMIDEQGNLTGFIDWDLVRTSPSFQGCTRYPSWITDDWSPLMFQYPDVEGLESPKELNICRSYYERQMRRLLSGRGDSKFTIKSHIYEAVAFAAANHDCRYYIVLKIVKRIFRLEEDWDDRNFITNLGDGLINKKQIKQLQNRLRALLSISKTR